MKCEEKEESSKAKMKYSDIISTLPRENGWTTSNSLYQYQGFWYPSLFLESIISTQEHFKAQPTDLIVCSAPKSGTTWLKALTFAITTRNQFNESTNPLLTTIPHECIPLLEYDLAKNPTYRPPKLPLLATHLPYTSLPRSILACGCKILYVCRDPKDTFVSLWHFACKLGPKDAQYLPLEKAFEQFCKGISAYGPYWDHALGYWKASLECPERVMFLKYEDMKRDTVFHVKRLAEYAGQPFSMEEEMEGVPQRITELCSFEHMSNLEVNKSGKHRPNSPMAINNSMYFRKGIVGDWKNHLTTEMIELLDQITEQKLGGSGLTFHVSSSP
ncbi:flavonol 3-sulfotransferase-like [Cornus florida]|uniref:flavonol 3-sulfotransferase-like n=1 Tax=Cornus florida TaxID=4283 RepID=UPI00289F07DA|nr:flavonol 3-sulfotransferase-like [Cornus florida]